MTSEELKFKIQGRVNWMFWDFEKLKKRERLEDKERQPTSLNCTNK